MSVRYSANRKTIAASSLPGEIARECAHLLSPEQKAMLCRDIRSELEMTRGFARDEMREQVDAPQWEVLADAFDPTKHVNVTTEFEGKRQSHVCFLHEDRYVEVDNYFKTGKRSMYLNPDYIAND